MKRKNKLHYRSIKSTVYYTIRGIILLPIRLILLPFKLIGGAVFYRKPKQILTLVGLRSINRRIFKNSDTISYLKKQLAHIETNLMYDNTPDEVNRRIQKLEDETKTHMNCFNGSESSHLLYLIKELEKYHKPSGIEMYGESHPEVMLTRMRNLNKDINELQLSLESISNKDKPKLTFYPCDEPTQVELNIIEAEAKGESVAKEEYDYTIEDRARKKQIQDRMRKDEAKIKQIDIESNNTMAMNGDIPEFLDD